MNLRISLNFALAQLLMLAIFAASEECDLSSNECVPLNDCPVLINSLVDANCSVPSDITQRLAKIRCPNSTEVCCPKTSTRVENDIEEEFGSRFGNFNLLLQF
jgi:hypothetical protein